MRFSRQLQTRVLKSKLLLEKLTTDDSSVFIQKRVGVRAVADSCWNDLSTRLGRVVGILAPGFWLISVLVDLGRLGITVGSSGQKRVGQMDWFAGFTSKTFGSYLEVDAGVLI